ncbi:DUF883 family protein [Methylophaga sp.]|uniref:DUF883 family protein n=1 Tax=Methylophaga sp. TaxID=2024840 RepID=UPI003F69E2E0
MATQASNQELQDQLDTLRKDFSELTQTMKTMTSDYAKQGQDKLKEKADYAQEQARDSFYKAQGEVETHPYTSMAVAFGVGLVIGKILDK